MTFGRKMGEKVFSFRVLGKVCFLFGMFEEIKKRNECSSTNLRSEFNDRRDLVLIKKVLFKY